MTHFYTCKYSWIFPKARDFLGQLEAEIHELKSFELGRRSRENLEIQDRPRTKRI